MTGKTWAELGVKAGDVVEYVTDHPEIKGYTKTVSEGPDGILGCPSPSGRTFRGVHPVWRIVSRAIPEPLAYDVIHYRSAEDIAAGICPVPEGADVTVWFRDGDTARDTMKSGHDWSENGYDTVTAFLIHTPQSSLTDAEFIALVRGASGTAKDMFGYWISGDRDNPTFDAVIAYLNKGEE